MNEYIKSDLMRYYGKCDVLTFFIAYIRNSTFRFQCIFRLCKYGGGSQSYRVIFMGVKQNQEIYSIT